MERPVARVSRWPAATSDMIAHDAGTPNLERTLRHVLGMGPRPTAHNPEAGQLLVGAAAAVALAALAWLAFALASACSYGFACAATGFAAVVSAMGAAKYVEFAAPQPPGAEPYEEASAGLLLTLLVGGCALGLVNAAIGIVTSRIGHGATGLGALLLLDAVAALVCVKERQIERFLSAPARKKAA
ncbi:hypothetical protein KFE25_014000 [Diacronema lutheri]|uniref:Uncharacterized protein n=2 Tax=Diacronema lutheri TaxID=2081491 RepID=A0A8J5X693_DIALT|nr:hypothetical protein KFE25_014000 [Diacronema lutheri]